VIIPFEDVVGYWLGIVLTLFILSFLYKDNPFYKFAEHLFIGVSIGYVITQQYYNTLRPKLIDHISADGGVPRLADWWLLVPLVLSALMMIKAASRKWAWVGRYPLAFVVAFFAGLQVNGVATADLGEQMKRSMAPLTVDKVDINRAPYEALSQLPGVSPAVARGIIARRETQPFASLDEVARIDGLTPMQRADLADARGNIQGLDAQAAVAGGQKYWFGIFGRVLMLAGLLASLIYFYYSLEQKGALGKVSRFGVWILMIGFGASFGYTVQGRISLAIGRAMDVMGEDKDPALAAQIDGSLVALIAIGALIAGLAAWELRNRARRRDAGSTGGAPPAQS
jgi:hypothetical protein